MWGWTFEPAFAQSDLDADYWIIKVGDKSSRNTLEPYRRRGLAPGPPATTARSASSARSSGLAR